jgi:MtN3 and saliva related transmembrane protein
MRETIGIIAAILTTVSFLPQAYKTIRTRDTSGISLAMYLLFTVGVGLWFVYGITLDDPAIYLANGITAVLTVIILSIKIRSVLGQRRDKAGRSGT